MLTLDQVTLEMDTWASSKIDIEVFEENVTEWVKTLTPSQRLYVIASLETRRIASLKMLEVFNKFYESNSNGHTTTNGSGKS